MKSPFRGTSAATVAVAAAFGLSLLGPHRAYAAPVNSISAQDSDLAVTVLSPTPRSTFSGVKPVEVSAFYQGSAANQIVSLELYVDGLKAATKNLDSPETRGVISFLIDASALSAGTHRIVIRAVAADAEISSAKSSFVFDIPNQDNGNDGNSGPTINATPSIPDLSYTNPALDNPVAGTVNITINAHDRTGKAPYVSLYIDRSFKMLRNYPPYDFAWDTTAYSNGYHTVEAYGYNDSQNVSPAKTIRVYVNNPGGRTEVRTDLTDAAPTHKAAPRRAVKARHPKTTLVAKRVFTPTLVTPIQKDTPGLSNPFVPLAPVKPAPVKHAVGPAELATEPTRVVTHHATPTLIARALPTPDSTEFETPVDLSSPFIPETVVPKPAPVAVRQKIVPVEEPILATNPGHVASRPAPQPLLIARNIVPTLQEDRSIDLQLSSPFVPAVTAQPKAPRVKAGLALGTAARLNVRAQKSAVQTPRLQRHSPMGEPALAAVTPTVVQKTAVPVLIARREALELSAVGSANTLGLTSPYVPATQAAKGTAPRKVEIAGPLTAHVNPQVAPHHTTPKLILMAKSEVTDFGLSSPFLIAPHLPVMKHVAVRVPVTKHLAAQLPIVKHVVKVHMASAPMTASMLRCKGQTAILFNSMRLRLDRPLASHNSVLFSPIRQIFEFQGGSLTWNSKTQAVEARTETKDIHLTIGKRAVKVNDQHYTLDGTPYLAQGRTMVPLSLLPIALDVDVHYDSATGHLLVTNKK